MGSPFVLGPAIKAKSRYCNALIINVFRFNAGTFIALLRCAMPSQNVEQDILDYLRAWPGSFISGKEIAKKIGGKERFDADRGWAIPLLTAMVRKGAIETDHVGGFRLKVQEERKKKEPQHVSPQLLKILKTSGKKFDGVNMDDSKYEPPVPVYRKPADAEGGGS